MTDSIRIKLDHGDYELSLSTAHVERLLTALERIDSAITHLADNYLPTQKESI